MASKRPYCFHNPLVWDTKRKRWGMTVPHRYYTYPGRAHDSCMWFAKHSKVGTVIELLNRDNMNLLAVYVREERNVTWYNGKDAKEVVRRATKEIQANNGRKASEGIQANGEEGNEHPAGGDQAAKGRAYGHNTPRLQAVK